MSRSISPAMQTHLNGPVTTLASCWKITRVDGTVLGFTSHTRDLLISGVAYKAATGISPTTVSASLQLSVDNLEVKSILDSSAIQEQDLLAGLYDYASVLMFLVNYNDLSMGTISLTRGTIGEVSFMDGQFTAEARSLFQNLQQNALGLTSPTCRVKALGDADCQVNLAGVTATGQAITYNGAITAVTSQKIFTDSGATQPAGFFTLGTIKFTSGLNTGLALEVKAFLAGQYTTQTRFPYAVTPGDTYTAIAGCDRTRGTCITKFNNILNFRGEPDVPGMDAILKNP